MEEVKLDVQLRSKVGSRTVKEIRRNGFVPAIVYGGSEHGPVPIKVELRSYAKIMRQLSGQSFIFHLNVLEGDKKVRDYSAIVKEEQTEPVSDDLLHIDFKRISLKENIEVKVQVNLVGEPIGVKQDRGSLDHTLWELDVFCLPTNLPKAIEVDVSELHIGEGIHIKDITLPDGVQTKHDPEAMIASVVAPMAEENATDAAEGEPEVIGEADRQERKETKEEEQAAKEADAEEKSK
ncbi:MAG: large subunit ribosomal protein L25 [Candidatus Omnitrophota bacterium]|jgi:large subunit ribosomal protein L25